MKLVAVAVVVSFNLTMAKFLCLSKTYFEAMLPLSCSSGGTSEWCYYHKSLESGSEHKFVVV